jgi:hypothetical protein
MHTFRVGQSSRTIPTRVLGGLVVNAFRSGVSTYTICAGSPNLVQIVRYYMRAWLQSERFQVVLTRFQSFPGRFAANRSFARKAGRSGTWLLPGAWSCHGCVCRPSGFPNGPGKSAPAGSQSASPSMVCSWRARRPLDFSFAIRVSNAARQCDGAIVGKDVAIQRVQGWIIDIGSSTPSLRLSSTIVRQTPPIRRNPCSMEFGPRARAGLEGKQANGLAAVAQREYEQACSPVSASVRIAHHRPAAVVDLRFLAGCRDDDGTGRLLPGARATGRRSA